MNNKNIHTTLLRENYNMTRTILQFLLCTLLCSCSHGCDEDEVTLQVVNGTDRTVYCSWSFPRSYDYAVNPSSTPLYAFERIEAHGKYSASLYTDEMDRKYGFHIMLIKEETRVRYDSLHVEETKVYDRFLHLSYGELEDMNFTIRIDSL